MTQEQIFELVMQFGAEVAIKMLNDHLPAQLPIGNIGINY